MSRASPIPEVGRGAEPLPDAVAPPTAAITRLAGDADFSYGDLRARAIALAQAASGQLWTDYNLHDPGVTLLESLCYALTEGVFGAQADVADLLTAPDGRIHYRRHALHAAEDVLPCRPTTELDLLRYLLDRVPAVRQLRLHMTDVHGQADGRSGVAGGLWQMALRVTDGDGEAATRDIARAYLAQRNLGEDLQAAPQVLRPRWCALEISLSVSGARELGDILVELMQRCADIVGAAPPRQPLQARLAQRDVHGNPVGTAGMFEGPLVQCGWIAAEDLRRDPANRLYFSDLARALREIDGVSGIGALRLAPLDAAGKPAMDDAAGGADGANGDEGAEDSLPWHGADWALQLRWPDTPEMLAGWQVTRRGSRLHIDTRALLERLADARQAQRVASTAPRVSPFAGHLLARPAGRYLSESPYLSIWHHLPPLYREYHLAPRADAESQAQFAAYLALLEQWQAHGNAQMQHLRQLFSIERDPIESYWWEPLDATHIPGLAGVDDAPANAIAPALASADDVLDRRSRVLDLLLALHGESCDQHSIQRFGVYYEAAEWRRHLYGCKRRFVQRIVRHTRDRAGAFDYSRPSLGRRGNTAPLQERVCLLLGFAHSHSRLLAGTLAAHGIALDTRPWHGPGCEPPAGAQQLVMWPPLRARIVAHFEEDLALRQVHERLAFHFTALDPNALPAALFRCAAHAGHYHRVEGDAGPELWLGPDETGHWWQLAVREGPGDVLAPALYLHELACRLQRDAEGLHLVEHVLLRPLGQPDESDDVPDDFYSHRITVILPGWTARGADRSFRDLAAETIALGCPAHLLPDVHWLDHAALTAFEHDFEAWIEARVRHAADSATPEATALLDACARRLRNRLLALSPAPHGERQ